MARFMISMPDDMLKKLDDAARQEHRSRSELLREAIRHHLNLDGYAQTAHDRPSESKRKIPKGGSKGSLREHLLELGVGQKGCPGLDRLVGPIGGGIDRQRLLKAGRKLTGLSRTIMDSREDRW